jgi:hypothetical protein
MGAIKTDFARTTAVWGSTVLENRDAKRDPHFEERDCHRMQGRRGVSWPLFAQANIAWLELADRVCGPERTGHTEACWRV